MEPVHILTEEGHTLVQQKRRSIVLHYKEKFKEHFEELKAAGVVSGPLESEWATRWIYNMVINGMSLTKKNICITLDTHPMVKAVETLHFLVLTLQELRHQFTGSSQFSRVNSNPAFHQL